MRENSQYHLFVGSLARRAALVALAFLVIPLLLYAFFAYRFEYRERSRDLFQNLTLLTSDRVDLVSEFAHEEFDALKLIQAFVSENPPESLNDFLAHLKQYKNATAIFYLTRENDKLLCTASSNPDMVGNDYTHFGALKYFEEQTPYLFSQKDEIVFSLPISSSKSINIALDAPYFFDKLPPLPKIFFPKVLTALLDEEGKILATNHKDLIGKRILQDLSPLPDVPDGFQFVLNKAERFAIKLPIERSSLSIFVSAKKAWIYEKYFSQIVRMAILFLFIVLIGGLITLLLTMRIAKPLKKLSAVMQKVGSGDLSARFSEDRMGFEINVLGEIFNHMVKSLTHYVEETKELETQKESLKKELLIGHEVQKSILPKEIPEIPGLDIATGFLSAKEVGGDFYDILKLDENRLMISIADTAGKGVSACFYSLVLRSILRSFALKTSDLAELVAGANNLFCKDTGDTGVFVTTWIGLYDIQKKELTYASSGHHPALLKKVDGSLKRLKTAGMALGVEPLSSIDLVTAGLETGDVLLLFTDGVIDAFNPSKERYTEQRLEKIFQKEGRKRSSEYINDILDDVFAFSSHEPQFDDITLMTLKVE